MEREPIWVDSEWEEIRDAFRTCIEKPETLAYFTLARVIDAASGSYEAGQRCDFNADFLARFLNVEQTLAAEADPRALIEPALVWLRARAENWQVGQSTGTFRVQLLSPRGEKKLATLRFTLAYEEYATPAKAPSSIDVDGSLARIARAMEALAKSYEQFNGWQMGAMQRLTSVFWDIQHFYERVIRAASGENVSLRAELQRFMDSHHQKMAELHGQLLSVKVEVARVHIEGDAAANAQQRDVELEKARLALGEKLGGNFIDGLAEIGKTWMAAKLQVDPRLMNFLKLASADEELLGMLTQPEVVGHLDSPGAGTAILEMLKEILRTPPLLAALANPALPRALRQPRVKQTLIGALQSLSASVEAEEQARKEAEEAEKRPADPPPERPDPPSEEQK